MIRLTAKYRTPRASEPIAAVVDPLALEATPLPARTEPVSLGADFNFELLVREYVPKRLEDIATELQALQVRCVSLSNEAQMLERVRQAID